MPEETAVADTSAAPADSAPETQSQTAPGAGAADTAAGAGAQAAPEGQGTAGEQTPPGTLAGAINAVEGAQPQAQLLAGKFKTPQDLEKGYQEAQKLISRSTQERKELETQLAQIRQAATGQQQPQQQQDPFMERWVQNPIYGKLANPPDPRYDPQGHAEWMEKTFVPYFSNDPVGTFRYIVAPEIRAGLLEMRESIMQEFQTRDTAHQLTGFFQSKPDYLKGKSINDAFIEWGPGVVGDYRDLMDKGVPVEAIVEILALRRGQAPLQAAAAAAQAKERDLANLASGAPNRGAASSTDEGLVGEGESFGEKMHNALKKQGMPLDREPVMPRNPFGGKKGKQ